MSPSSPPPAPPYGLPPTPTVPFPALAALAGRSALGDTRETVLACLLGARLALATLPPYRLTPEQRRQRAADALAWLAALALPSAVRSALTALYEAAGRAPGTERPALIAALHGTRESAAKALDEPAAAELARLAEALRLSAPDALPTR